MQLTLKDKLPFVNVLLTYRGKTINIDSVLVDTGSATTLLSADQVESIDIHPSPDDILYSIRGVGGNEVVFARNVDQLLVGRHGVADFEVEFGGMDYGFEINGILGMNFLTMTGAVINLWNLTITFVNKEL
jgi:hypothetical protein